MVRKGEGEGGAWSAKGEGGAGGEERGAKMTLPLFVPHLPFILSLILDPSPLPPAGV